MPAPTNEDLHKALWLIASVRAALKNGIRHYNEAVELLEDEKAILIAIQQGPVNIDTAQRKQVTTDESELAIILATLVK